jgi:plasmid stabilization system protein ParE
MAQGDKGKYTPKQKRKATKIAKGYKKSGTSTKEAERRAWATVNASDGGGKKAGSGRGKKANKAPAKKGGRKGGAASAKRSAAKKSASAKKAAKTRARRKS